MNLPGISIPAENPFIAFQVIDVHPQVGESFYTSLFSDKFSLLPDINLTIFDALIGGVFVINAAVNIKTFFDTFRYREPKLSPYLVPVEKEWDKFEIRVFSLVASIGAISRFIDFGLDRNWFVASIAHSVALKAIGGLTGFVTYGNRAMTSLGNLKEADRISAYAQKTGLHRPGHFNAYWYSEFFLFVSNTSFMMYGGVQFSAACLCSVAALEVSGTVLLSGIIFGVFALLMRQMDHTAQDRDILSLADRGNQRLTLHEKSLVRY